MISRCRTWLFATRSSISLWRMPSSFSSISPRLSLGLRQLADLLTSGCSGGFRCEMACSAHITVTCSHALRPKHWPSKSSSKLRRLNVKRVQFMTLCKERLVSVMSMQLRRNLLLSRYGHCSVGVQLKATPALPAVLRLLRIQSSGHQLSPQLPLPRHPRAPLRISCQTQR